MSEPVGSDRPAGDQPAGIVLAGGSGSRIGGPKAALLVEGTTLAVRAVRTLREVAAPVFVVIGKDAPPPDVEAPVLRDRVPGKGPLEGLAVGLHAMLGLGVGLAPGPGSEWALVLACDLPFVRRGVLELLSSLRGSADAIVPRTRDGPHPLLACYRVAVLQQVEEALAGDDLSLHGLLRRISVREIEETELRSVDWDLRSFWNVNTREDLDEGLRRFGKDS